MSASDSTIPLYFTFATMAINGVPFHSSWNEPNSMEFSMVPWPSRLLFGGEKTRRRRAGELGTSENPDR